MNDNTVLNGTKKKKKKEVQVMRQGCKVLCEVWLELFSQFFWLYSELL